jgi:hypothetical protein
MEQGSTDPPRREPASRKRMTERIVNSIVHNMAS